MSQGKNDYNMFDPLGTFKAMRDEGLDTWAKMMTQLVNTDAYADAMGKSLDAWLSSSEPFRKMMDRSISQSLSEMNIPSRDDICRLAERLTNIEMRLDDLDAKLDDLVSAARPAPDSQQVRDPA